jgi:hypothetical protein
MDRAHRRGRVIRRQYPNQKIFVRMRLVPMPVPTSWQPEIGYFPSLYKTTVIGIFFEK